MLRSPAIESVGVDTIRPPIYGRVSIEFVGADAHIGPHNI